MILQVIPWNPGLMSQWFTVAKIFFWICQIVVDCSILDRFFSGFPPTVRDWTAYIYILKWIAPKEQHHRTVKKLDRINSSKTPFLSFRSPLKWIFSSLFVNLDMFFSKYINPWNALLFFWRTIKPQLSVAGFLFSYMVAKRTKEKHGSGNGSWTHVSADLPISLRLAFWCCTKKSEDSKILVPPMWKIVHI